MVENNSGGSLSMLTDVPTPRGGTLASVLWSHCRNWLEHGERRHRCQDAGEDETVVKICFSTLPLMMFALACCDDDKQPTSQQNSRVSATTFVA